MKKLIPFVLLIMATTVAFSQAVQRNKVILEIATATWCVYCPGAAVAADQLVSNGKQVAVIEYHDNDAYANAASNGRNSYYNISGVPTAHFDGTSSSVGGLACPGDGLYSNYLSKYNSRYAVQSPLTIDISGTNSGDNYTVVLSIHKVADVTGTDLRAMLVLTESGISCSWPTVSGGYCLSQLNYVERLMAPDFNGTSFSFASGDMQIITVSFTKTSSWVNANCKLIAFVQDHGSKTIYNGTQVALNSIPAPVPVDFTADNTSGCAPLTVNYTDQSTGVDTYQWNLPGGTPSTSALQNPSITYNIGGTFDATLVAWKSSLSRGNIKVKPSYINIPTPTVFSMTGGGATCATVGTGSPVGLNGSQTGINYTLYLDGTATSTVVAGTGGAITFGNQLIGGNYSSQAYNPSSTCNSVMNGVSVVTVDPQVPDAPAQPTGNSAPAPGTTTDYITAGATYATSYSWDVTPADAGTFTGSTTTGSITWSSTYQGPANIKVRGVNSCGNGDYSVDFPVNVTTGITELTKQKIVNFYPNPAKGMINIIPLYKMKTDLKVYNSLGSVVIEKNNLNLNGTYQLDISGLTPGIYYFNILTDNAQQIQKVIVQ